MEEAVVHREEAVGLLFNVATMVELLADIKELLQDDEEEDEG